MTEFGSFQLVILPLGLGLLGFVEPCSIGSSLVFIRYIEGQSAAARIAQVGAFALTRALLIGALGALVALIGTIFLSLQKGAWLLLGLLTSRSAQTRRRPSRSWRSAGRMASATGRPRVSVIR